MLTVAILFCSICFVMACYLAWNDEYEAKTKFAAQLVPKLTIDFDSIKDGFILSTQIEGDEPITFVRVLPIPNATLYNCTGYLEQVDKLVSGEWIPTAYHERFTLKWSYRGFEPLRLDPGSRQFLDVFRVDGQRRTIMPVISFYPTKAMDVFTSTDTFRFHIAIVGDGSARALIFLKVKSGTHWDKPEVEELV